MSTEAFEDYYFDVCTLDYSRMERAMVPLKSLMEETDEVRIVGENTDLRFSIKDIPVIPCAGEYNIPGRRMLHLTRTRFRQRHNPFQYTDNLSGNNLYGHPTPI